MADLFLLRWAKLYSDPTPAERSLEPAVAALAVPYRFQHAMFGLRIFPDFALPTLKVVFEVDDPGHRRKAQKEKDAERTAKLERAGWKVVRCTNAEALADPVGAVRRMITEAGHPSLAQKLDK